MSRETTCPRRVALKSGKISDHRVLARITSNTLSKTMELAWAKTCIFCVAIEHNDDHSCSIAMLTVFAGEKIFPSALLFDFASGRAGSISFRIKMPLTTKVAKANVNRTRIGNPTSN
jgi:hypothetical protein